MDNNVLNDQDLNQVSGGVLNNAHEKCVVGMPNPVEGLSFNEALKNAEKLGVSQENMGTWTKMSMKDYLKWWRSSNSNTKEYLDHQKEVDDFIGDK